MIECSVCGEMFDINSQRKKQSGGLRNHCPDCSEEHVVPYLGVANASGKVAGIEVIAFDNAGDREKFQRGWAKNKGMHKGKSSALGCAGGLSGISFRRVADFGRNDNNKGKA